LTSRQRDLSTFVRIEVSDGDDRCEIDLAIDYRALPAEPSDYGPTLAVRELAANKVLALFDRAEARDFLDLVELTRHFELPGLLELAAEKDRASIRPDSSKLCRLSRGSRPPTSESRRPSTNVSVPRWRAGGASLVGAKAGSRLTATPVSIGSRQARLRRKAAGTNGADTGFGPRLVRAWSAKR
jgi:hypothetical protein